MAKKQTLIGAAVGGPAIKRTPDLARVAALERRSRPIEGEPDAEELTDTVTSWFSNGRAAGDGCECTELGKPCMTRLRLVQAWTLLELSTERGVLGNIGTGWGKSLLDMLAPLAFDGCRLALLLVPNNLATQLAKQYRHARQHFRMPSIRIHGSSPWRCDAPALPNGRPAPLLHVMPYSMLSSETSSVFIENLAPDLIIADECQNIARLSARTRRVIRQAQRREETRFAFWSGTITNASMMDYWRLAILALRELAPVPLDREVAESWATAIDPSGWPAPAGALADEFCADEGEHVQEGWHRRLAETPGVVITSDPSADVELEIVECEDLPVPRKIRDMLDEVRLTRVRPDGDPLPDNLSLSRCLRELACGFYLVWYFPGCEPDDLIARWRAAKKAWCAEVRDRTDLNLPHQDSQKLCARAAERHYRGDYRGDLPVWQSESWPEFAAVKDRVHPVTRAVWVDDFVVHDAIAFGHNLADGPGILWYDSPELGERISRLGQIPLHDGGVDAGDRMDAELARADARSIVASIRSHGTGREGMQYRFRRQRVIQVPASAVGWEQLLGRLARPGQSGTVRTEVAAHTRELRRAFETATGRAAYVQRTIGSPQKILAG